MSLMHQWARFYASMGWSIFPLVPGTKSPFKGTHGSSEATTDLAQVDAWWSTHPEANIGIRPSAAGLYVFDVDPRNGGIEDVARLEAEHGPIDSPLRVQSPSGGWHLYFAAPPGQRYSGKPADGIDGKYNGYAVLPPSIHPDGGRYTWAGDVKAAPAAIPQWLVQPVIERPKRASAGGGDIADAAKIAEALDVLDPTDYHQWVHAMASVKHWEDTTPGAEGVGYALVREWSRGDPRHDDGQFEDKWFTWDSHREGARTLGSLLHEAGMTQSQQVRDAAVIFAQSGPEARAAMWPNEPTVSFPKRIAPDELAVDLVATGGAFQQALTEGNLDRMVWIAVRQYPGECDKVLALLVALGMQDADDIRALIAAHMAALPPVDPVELGNGESLSKDPMKIEDAPIYGPEAQLDIFAGCVIVPKRNAALLPDGELLGPEAFNAAFPAGIYALSDRKAVDKPWQAFVSSQFMRWPRVNDVAFRPDLPPLSLFEEDGRPMANNYVPHVLRRAAADVTPFLRHLELMIPDARDREILLAWMAALAQYPGRKFRWAPVLQGCEGNGKGLITSVLQYIVGRRYTHIAQASDLANKFNDWLVGRLLVIINEADFGKDREVIDAIKPLISDDDVGVQGKNKAQETSRNFANFFLTTNHVGAIGQAVKGRRYSVFVTAQQGDDDCELSGMTGDYFDKLIAWQRSGGFEAIADYLINYDIPAAFNPAGKCVRAPRTSSYGITLEAAKGSVEQAIEEAIEEGRPGFRVPFVCGAALNKLLDDARRGMSVPKNKRREVMQSLGYDWHPSLPGGRANRVLGVSGNVKPVIFVKKSHPAWQLRNPIDLIKRFEQTMTPFLSSDDSIDASSSIE